jgi:hypothetical protein
VVVADKDVVERAKEMFVYGPLGLALYVKDTAPSFLKLFVARGRNELDQRRKAVGEQIDQMRTTGETAATDHAPALLRIVSEGLTAARERAEEALEALGVLANEESSIQTREPPVYVPAGGTSTSRRDDTTRLAIPNYDDLSASQVVDRLEGLGTDDLEAIRAYEASNRARNTILGKIAQLTRGV